MFEVINSILIHNIYFLNIVYIYLLFWKIQVKQEENYLKFDRPRE